MDIDGWIRGWIAMRIKIVHVRSNRCNGFVPLDRLLVFIDIMYRICSGERDGINILILITFGLKFKQKINIGRKFTRITD